MTKKIKFNVIHASGEDEKHKASELDKHGPAIRGWQSSRNCDYPQEIILFLHRPTVLQQIQILAHQYLIPERIDLWIGPEIEGVLSDFSDFAHEFTFEFLGYILLSDNTKSDFKSRELKSITLPASPYTSFVKLSLHQNHANKYNEFNQVSIVAVQILGSEKIGPLEIDCSNNETSINNTSAPSIYDDLAFEMYVDRDIANIIRSLDARKQIAVQDERYEYARKLKLTIEDLRIVGEKLGKLEITKKQAIQEEDYSRAKRKKTQIESLKKEIYERINIDNLLEVNGVLPENDEESDVCEKDGALSNTTSATDILNPSQQFSMPHVNGSLLNNKQLLNSCAPSPPLEANTDGKDQSNPGMYESPVSPLHGVFGGSSDSPTGGTPPVKPRAIIVQPVSIKTGSFRRRNKSAEPQASGRNSYEAYDERTVPAQRNMHSSDTARENSISGGNFGLHSKLNEREKKQAALPITVFGLRLVEKFYSKHFSDKEEGLRLLEAQLKTLVRNELKIPDSQEIHSPNKIARATIFLLHRAIRDKVFAVYNVATEVIRYFFNEFVPGRVTTGEVSRSIEKLLPELLSKSGDTMPRIHNIAVHTILSLADAPDVKGLHIIPVHLTRPLTANTHPRLALSRLQMVEQLIINHGISNEKQSGMTCRILAEFGSSGLHHPAEAVRKIAEKVLIHVYRVNPRIVRKQLPPDDDISRRNILYRHLLQEFDIIDKENKGEPTKDCNNKMVRSNSESVANSLMYSPPIRQSSSTSSTLEKKTPVPVTHTHTHSHPSKNLLVTCSSSSSSTGNLTPTCETDKQCIFCLTISDSFSEEGLNIHYWRYCPMLTRCQHCQEVVELSGLYNHLSEECDFRTMYVKCKKCHEPILAKQFDLHRKSSSCIVLDGVSKCPLCNELLASGEDSWRAHYTGSEPCMKNPRLPFNHNF